MFRGHGLSPRDVNCKDGLSASMIFPHEKSFLSIDNIFVPIRYSYAMMLAPGPPSGDWSVFSS